MLRLFVLLSIMAFGARSFAQQSANVIAPNALLEFLNLGAGEKAAASVIARNETSSPITISSAAVSVGADHFTFTPSTAFPVQIAPGKQTQIGTVSVSLKTVNEDYVGYLIVKHSPQAHTEDGEVRLHAATTAIPTMSSTAIPLGDSTKVLGMSSTEWQFSREFTFQNSLGHPVTITDVSMLSGNAGIEIVSLVGASLPVTLDPGEKVTARLTYNTANNDLQADRINFVLEDAGSISYAIKAAHVTANNIKNGAARAQIPLSISPNPATESVTIQMFGGYKGDVAIYTTDGKLMLEQKSTNNWTAKTDTFSPGEYVIKITAAAGGGITITQSEKLVIASKS